MKNFPIGASSQSFLQLSKEKYIAYEYLCSSPFRGMSLLESIRESWLHQDLAPPPILGTEAIWPTHWTYTCSVAGSGQVT